MNGDRGSVRPRARRAGLSLLAVISFALIATLLLPGLVPDARATPATASDEETGVALPGDLTSYSFFTSKDDSPGRSLLGFQRGHDVEFFDSPQYVVVTADGRRVRRVPAVESRADANGDFPLTALSPDGVRLAIGTTASDQGSSYQGSSDQTSSAASTLAVLDLITGRLTEYPVTTFPDSVSPLGWADDDTLWVITSAVTDRATGAITQHLVSVSTRSHETRIVSSKRLPAAAAGSSLIGLRQLGATVGPPGRVATFVPWPSEPGEVGPAATGAGAHEPTHVYDSTGARPLATWPEVGDVQAWSPGGGLMIGHDNDGNLLRFAVDADLQLTDRRQLPPAPDGQVLGWQSEDTAILATGIGTGGEPFLINWWKPTTGDVGVLATHDGGIRGIGLSGLTMARGLAAGLVVDPDLRPDPGPGRQIPPLLTAVGALALTAWIIRRRARRGGGDSGLAALRRPGRGVAQRGGALAGHEDQPVVQPGDPPLPELDLDRTQ